MRNDFFVLRGFVGQLIAQHAYFNFVTQPLKTTELKQIVI